MAPAFLSLFFACSAREEVKDVQVPLSQVATEEGGETEQAVQDANEIEAGGLEYSRRLNVSKEMYMALLIDRFTRDAEAPEIVEIDGSTAAKMLEAESLIRPFDDDFNDYLAALLARSDAKAYFYSMPLIEGAPTGAVFVPWPEEGFRPKPGGSDSPGMFMLFGIGHDSKQKEVSSPTPEQFFVGKSLE